jgi:type II secretory pathway pseudopilin PulG
MSYLADWNLRRDCGRARDWRSDAGFSLLEMILITVIAGGVMAMAIMGLGSSVSAAKSRGAVAQIKQQMVNARELAISQQRDIKIAFTAPNIITVTRVNRPATAGETVISTVRLEGGMTFQKYGTLPETPDPWGGAGAIAFGGVANMRFRSGDGALVDPTNNFVNGRVFVGLNTKTNSAGMVSIFGATGRIRSYRAMGGTWEY